MGLWEFDPLVLSYDRCVKFQTVHPSNHLSSRFCLHTEDSKRPVSMGEELDSLKTTIDDQNIHDSNSTGTHPGSQHRRKRFLSYPRYVELMVTADAKMVRHHGRNLEHYILTIMSVVSKLMFLKTIFFSQGARRICVQRYWVIGCVFNTCTHTHARVSY